MIIRKAFYEIGSDSKLKWKKYIKFANKMKNKYWHDCYDHASKKSIKKRKKFEKKYCYDLTETFELDYQMAIFLLQRIPFLWKHSCTVPANLFDVYDSAAKEKWNQILKCICNGLYNYLRGTCTFEEWEETKKLIHRYWDDLSY